DGRALDDLLRVAGSQGEDPASRRDALRILAEAQAQSALPLLRKLVDDRDLGAEAARGLAAFDDPNIAPFLVKRLPGLRPAARDQAIATLSARPASARMLLDALAAGQVDRSMIPPFQVRQMAGTGDEGVRKKVAELWPELRPLAAAKKDRI